MRSSLILGVVLLLTVAAPSVIQAHSGKSEECGHLGPGINACKCGEVVVKAAKVQKPLFYASPEAIVEAAAARQAVGNVASLSNYNKPCGCGSGSGSGSFSSSSSLSSVGFVGGSKAYSRAKLTPFTSVSGRLGAKCGCGKTSESLQVRDLLTSDVEGKVVPSFPPIGDLCYPSSRSLNKLQMTTKVTPAYPGKIKCAPPIPYEVCIQVLNGQIDEAGLRKLGLATGGRLSEYGISNGATTARNGGGSFGGGYASSSASSSAYALGGFAGSSGASSSAGSSAYGRGGFAGASGASSSAYGRGGFAGSSGASSSAGSSAYGRGGFAGASGASSSTYGLDGLARYGSYVDTGASSTAYAGYGSYANYAGSSNVRGSAASRTSTCESTNDFGDDPELPEDYSYPRLPADPVSVTLAYKNLFPRTVYYNRRAFVPEDKLAFGHRTVPTESTPARQVTDVPEEKLQIVNRPIVRLKPVSPVPVTVGVYDQHEEAKLAELEAIERERINQEEIAVRQRDNLITYGDLGYAPINQVSTAGPVAPVELNAEDEADCGPVGPPDPEYVPGSVLINRELAEDEREDDEVDGPRNGEDSERYVHRYRGDEASDEEDDSDDSTSGIFARLKSAARKYGPPCGAV